MCAAAAVQLPRLDRERVRKITAALLEAGGAVTDVDEINLQQPVAEKGEVSLFRGCDSLSVSRQGREPERCPAFAFPGSSGALFWTPAWLTP